MKRFVSALLVFVTLLSLTACSDSTGTSGLGSPVQQNNKTNEQKGVPQRQLETEVYPQWSGETYNVTSCTHAVDTTLHQDTVTIKYNKTYKYMRRDYTETHVYQYNKQTDIWTKISSEKATYKNTLLNNLNGETWSETIDVGFGLSLYYKVTVESVNISDGSIKFSYYIIFDKKEYRGTENMKDGNYVLTRVENLFRISFDPNTGISVSR